MTIAADERVIVEVVIVDDGVEECNYSIRYCMSSHKNGFGTNTIRVNLRTSPNGM